jgi:dolichol-phosphate mannosyltransferase
MPTYNEADNLPLMAESVLALPLPNLQLLIVDDDSPDGTGALAEEIARDHRTSAGEPRMSVLHRDAKDGLGRAYVAGMTHALEQGADFVAQMDGDGSHRTEYIPQMLGACLATGAGVVIGSRYVVGGALAEEWGPARRALSSWANFYVHAILGDVARDTTSGFNLWRRSVLEAIDLATIDSNGYSFQVEMKYRALRKGIKLLEIPIHFEERKSGVSKLGLSAQVESALMPLRLRRKYRRRH